LSPGATIALPGPTSDNATEADVWVEAAPASLADQFSAPDPDGTGTIYYKRINISDPADKTVMVTNSEYDTTTYYRTASYESSVTITATVTYEGVEYTVKEIGDYAFYDCVDLTSISLPEGLKTIGGYAFRGCTSLESVELPEGLETIGEYAFASGGLKSVTIPEGVTTIGDDAFYECISLESVNLPEDLETIGGATFYTCISLESVELPEVLETIGSFAFANTGLTSVTIPKEVTTIDVYAFAWSTALTDITLEWTTEEKIVTPDASILDGVEKSQITLHVPAGTKAIYANHPFWSVTPGGFKEIIDPAEHRIGYNPGGEDQNWTNP
jgi:hypothetical protein